jgi:hypothetical protein
MIQPQLKPTSVDQSCRLPIECFGIVHYSFRIVFSEQVVANQKQIFYTRMAARYSESENKVFIMSVTKPSKSRLKAMQSGRGARFPWKSGRGNVSRAILDKFSISLITFFPFLLFEKNYQLKNIANNTVVKCRITRAFLEIIHQV